MITEIYEKHLSYNFQVDVLFDIPEESVSLFEKHSLVLLFLIDLRRLLLKQFELKDLF